MFDGKKVLITGGTGSLGTSLTEKLLRTDVDTIRIFSRDEWKQVQMKSKFTDKRLRFFIGDVRDKERLSRALEGVDIVIHAAALKHVPVAEYNPFEAVKTNVQGTQNLIDACLENNVQTALAVGTDKAVSPLNTYGATKLLMERLFVSANYYKGNHKIKFICVRYGNVLGSRGSLVPTLVGQIQSGKNITITDPEMTRFNITMDEALALILRAIKKGRGGEIFVPKLKAYKVKDMRDAIIELLKSKSKTEIISIRPGEKYHESLIIKDEIRNTYENKEDYVIFEKETQEHELLPEFKKSTLKDQYSSDRVSLLSINELKQILVREELAVI
ncbi:SDR family NAD(P)-dependent oxidoreductase [Candidatus Nitrosotenuis aquarius]|uniref:SDR family NAD(P)-dependent oxidoreductase n=1 Tax=Candidatus Nitrosotenuis aquarius TaxID=1846278 RepID=UPI000C1ED371|nr:SDR family NAD(P)-dependent oxidoreductase [Candidatus Nitrosotenuis aquarius]